MALLKLLKSKVLGVEEKIDPALAKRLESVTGRDISGKLNISPEAVVQARTQPIATPTQVVTRSSIPQMTTTERVVTEMNKEVKPLPTSSFVRFLPEATKETLQSFGLTPLDVPDTEPFEQLSEGERRIAFLKEVPGSALKILKEFGKSGFGMVATPFVTLNALIKGEEVPTEVKIPFTDSNASTLLKTYEDARAAGLSPLMSSVLTTSRAAGDVLIVGGLAEGVKLSAKQVGKIPVGKSKIIKLTFKDIKNATIGDEALIRQGKQPLSAEKTAAIKKLTGDGFKIGELLKKGDINVKTGKQKTLGDLVLEEARRLQNDHRGMVKVPGIPEEPVTGVVPTEKLPAIPKPIPEQVGARAIPGMIKLKSVGGSSEVVQPVAKTIEPLVQEVPIIQATAEKVGREIIEPVKMEQATLVDSFEDFISKEFKTNESPEVKNIKTELERKITQMVDSTRKEMGLMAQKEGAGVTYRNIVDANGNFQWQAKDFSLAKAKKSMRTQAEDMRRYVTEILLEEDNNFKQLSGLLDGINNGDEASIKTTINILENIEPQKIIIDKIATDAMSKVSKQVRNELVQLAEDIKRGFDVTAEGKTVSPQRLLGIEKPKGVISNERTLLKIKAKSMSKISRETAREVRGEERKVRREKLAAQTARFKEKFDDMKVRQEKALEIVDQLPKEIQGRMKEAIVKSTTEARLTDLEIRVQRKLEKLQDQQAISEGKVLIEIASKSKIASEYVRKINDLVSTYDWVNMTKRTKHKLNSLRDYLDRESDAPISIKYVEKIKRLDKIPVGTLSLADKQELNKTLKELIENGKRLMRLRGEKAKREIEKNIKEATNSVVNRDKKGLEDMQKVEQLFQFGFRVGDRSDGDKLYRGWHVQTVQEAGKAINKAEIEESIELANFMQEHKKFSNFTENKIGQKEVAVHLYSEQGGEIQTKQILDDLGLKELPELTKEQEALKGLLREYAGNDLEEVKYLSETTMVDANGKPLFFELTDDYFPFLYEEKGSDLGVYSIATNWREQSKMIYQQAKGRKEGIKMTPRTDVYKMLQEHIARRRLFLNLQPILIEKGTVFRSKEYQEKAGIVNTTQWVGWIDEMSNYGFSSNALRTPMDNILRKGRMNISSGLLDFSFVTAAIQPGAIFDAAGYMSAFLPPEAVVNLAANFAQSFLRPGFAKSIIKQSPALQTRQGGEEVIALIGDKVPKELSENKYTKAVRKLVNPFEMLKFGDIRTAAAVQKTVMDTLKKYAPNMSEEQMIAEADFIMDLVSGSSNIAYRPRIMNKGEMGRAMVTFQTFVLNEWGIATEDVIRKGLIKGKRLDYNKAKELPSGKFRPEDVDSNSYSARMMAIIGLGLLFSQAYLEDKTRTAINNKVRGTYYEPDTLEETMLWYFPERIPVFGNLINGIRYRSTSSIAIISVFTNIFKFGAGALTSVTPEAKFKNFIKMVEAVAILYGVRGAKQLEDATEGIYYKTTTSDIEREMDKQKAEMDKVRKQMEKDLEKGKASTSRGKIKLKF